MNIVIVGGGRKVAFLIQSLLTKHDASDITVINKDEVDCKEIARTYEVHVVNGEASKPFILEDAGIKHADLIIALTPDDAKNLVICQLAKKVFNVTRAFATVTNPQNVEVFKQLGVDTAVSSTRIMANIIEQMATVHEMVSCMPISNGKLFVIEITVKAEHEITMQKLFELNNSNAGINVSGIVRNEKASIFNVTNALTLAEVQVDDRLTVITTAEEKDRAMKSLIG